MFKFARYIQDSSGNVQTSGTIDVYAAGTSTPISIFSDNTGTSKSNPFSIPGTGLVEFYLPNQRFAVKATTGAGTVTIDDLLAFDVDEQSGDITVADNLTVTDNLTVNGSFSPSVINTGARVDIASAATVNLETAAANYIRITGTTTITAITLSNGHYRDVVFAGVLTLTHNASTLILPGGASITTAAGDTMRVIGEASGVRVVDYTRASGLTVGSQTLGGLSGFYESSEATITNNTRTDFAHGLGAVPKLVTGVLRCKVTEGGYAVNDEIHYATQYMEVFGAGDTHTVGFTISSSATQVSFGVGNSPIYIPAKDASDSFVAITNANWRFVMRAWK